MIDRSAPYFERSAFVSEAALKTLDELLVLCKRRGIHVVGFLPSYAPSVYEKMLLKGGATYGYLSALGGLIAPIFSRP